MRESELAGFAVRAATRRDLQLSVPGTDLTGWRWLRGRARRREYALWLVVIFAWLYVAAWMQNPWVQMILATAFWLQTIRRLHDLGRTGWWIAAVVLGEISIVAVQATRAHAAWANTLPSAAFLCCLLLIAAWPGDRRGNRFGSPPRSGRQRMMSAQT